MSKCPYTWIKSFLGSSDRKGEASQLRVTVLKEGKTMVDVALPAKSATRLISIIPEEVVARIRREGIPIDDIQEDLSGRESFSPQSIFLLSEENRTVKVWLE